MRTNRYETKVDALNNEKAQTDVCHQVGDLIKDWRRLNVCFTRSRFKLIIFGSRLTLNEAPHMQEFFALVDERKWSYQMPAAARIDHSFEGGVHQDAQDDASVIRLLNQGPASTPSLSQVYTALSPTEASTSLRKRPADMTPACTASEVGLADNLSSEKRSTIVDPYDLAHDDRPSKLRKAAGIGRKAEKRTSSLSSLISKDRPILQDILNSQVGR